jgi:hypothetical protein
VNGTWEEVVVAEFEVMYRNFPRWTKETNKIPVRTVALAA